MKIRGQDIEDWKEWLENELINDGKENQVFNLKDLKKAKEVYKYLVEAFLETISKLKE